MLASSDKCSLENGQPQTLATPIGEIEATWTANGLFSFQFKDADVQTRTPHDDDSLREQRRAQLANAVATYFATGDFPWELADLDWHGVTAFHRRVLEMCFAIPAGQTRTYGELAQLAERPKAARAVGVAMANNRWPLLIPCHRVISRDGRLTGYSGAGGLDTKRRLLAFEAEKSEATTRQFKLPFTS